MIEYTTVLILILCTYIFAISNIKLPILGLIIVIIDILSLLPQPIVSGTVIIGYNIISGIAYPIVQNFSWLPLVIVVGIFFNLMTMLMKLDGRSF
jgi:hypothetical protein